LSTAEPVEQPEQPARPRGSSLRALLIGATIALLVAVLGVVSLLLGAHHDTSTQSQGNVLQVGEHVPTFTLPALNRPGTVGVPADGGGDGRGAVLVFFASWCGPCQREMPGLAKAVDEGVAGNAAVIGIDGQDTLAAATAFVKSTGITFPVGRDDVFAVTSGKFGFPGLPYTVFVNPKGIVTAVHPGAATPALIKAQAAKIQ
jgi:thiol-disulfide isomerase/thioredoxin